jgi:hypothetical protein
MATLADKPITGAEFELRQAMRKLWEDHLFWTRLYIISAADDLKDLDVTTQRLLKNQEDIGNAIKPVYGEAGGNKLIDLLKEHIIGAAELVTAAKAGNAAEAEDAEKRWYVNADEIAAFLSSANPAWPGKEMQDMMHDHLSLTKTEAVQRLTGDYSSDVKTFDEIVVQILGMADMLSAGIISQFPEKFGK